MSGPPLIAFAVLAHDDPEMVRLLADALAPRPVVVHVDAKADIEPFREIPGIRLVTDRVEVNWGGFAMVEATLRLYRDCLAALGDEKNSAVAVISGHDFPIRPVSEFEAYVANAPWSEHIRAIPLIADDSSRISRFQRNRVRKRWMFDTFSPHHRGLRGRAMALLRRTIAFVLPRRRMKAYAGLTLAMGSQWTLLSRACLEDLLPVALSPGYQDLFRRTFAPDELFFTTLVHSSRWGAQTQYGGLEDRDGKLTSEFPNFSFIDPMLAAWLDESWAPEVAQCDAYFARKITSEKLDGFLGALAEERARREVTRSD